MQAQKIIVIHPGSLYLRVGRASDLNPVTILHAIGLKRLDANATEYRDSLLPKLNEDALSEFEDHRRQVSHAIQAFPKSEERGGSKRLRAATPSQQIATFNKQSAPEEINSNEGQSELPIKIEERENSKNEIYNEEILKLNADSAAEYNIHFPMRRGEFNLHPGVGGSMTAMLAAMEKIWLHALCDLMGIKKSSLSQYNAALVIPDIYNRSHLREMVTLLLQRLRFRSCFLLQDHVAATFGTGLGYACVVDIGDQKCSISCVEDGISQPDTRVRLGYGGGDVTHVFQLLLKKCCFPYKECDVMENYADAALMTQLKEKFCHLNLDIVGAQERAFIVKKGNKSYRYAIQLGDECLVAPLALFHTELLNITGVDKRVRLQLRSSQQSDPEDCFDAEYIRETGRRNGRDQLLEGTMPVTGDMVDDDLAVDAFDNDRDATIKNNDKEVQAYMPNGQIMPLDQAIVRCIERCSTEEMKRKMYGCILLVGGSIKFPGFASWLEQRVKMQLMAYRNVDQTFFEINAFIRDMDSTMIAWKGGAIMSCLESATELWIFGTEWEKFGLRILREKAPFIW